MSETNHADQAELDRILEQLIADSSDESAWAALYRYMWPFVLAVCWRKLGDARGVAEDAAQDVFIRVFKYCDFENFEGQAQFRKYVRVIAENVCNRYLQRFALTCRRDNVEDTGSERKSLDRAIALDQLLGKLPSDDRLITEMVARGLRVGEIASRLGIAYGTAAVRIFRAKARLREIFTQS